MSTKVKSLSFKHFSSSKNDASGLGDYEVCDKQFSDYEFDNELNMLLNDSYINADKQLIDKNKCVKIIEGNCETSIHHMSPNGCSNSDKEIAFKNMAPITTDVNGKSFTALADNHFKLANNSEALEDSSVLDFLLDLSDFSGTSIASKPAKNAYSNNFGLSFSPSNSSADDIQPASKDEVVDEDLSLLLNSCDTKYSQSSLSLSDLASSHFLNIKDPNENKFENFKLPNLDFSASLESILSTGCPLSDGLIDSSVNEIQRNCHKQAEKSIDYLSDDEVIPDIDLNICIKKTQDNKSSIVDTTSPSSSDSGFDEHDFALLQGKRNIYDFLPHDCIEKEYESVLTNQKPSLISKAISCKTTSNKSRKEKVKSIRRELFKRHFPTAFHDSDATQNHEKRDNFEDKSNCCVIKINGRFMLPSQ